MECNAACDYAPVMMVNWEFFDNHDPGVGAGTGRRPAGRRGDIAPSRGAAALVTWRRRRRILAGYPDDQAADGHTAGAATPGGPADRQGARLDARRVTRWNTAREQRSVTQVLTPELTARWDEPDSFTLAGYRRGGGYQALPKALAMPARRGHRRRSRTPACAAAAGPASRPA